MEQTLDQLPPYGPAVEAEPEDTRPIDVQVSEVLDDVAVRLAKRLKTSALDPNADLKTVADAFKMLRDWLLARKKINKGDERGNEDAIDSAKKAFDHLTKAKAPPAYGTPIAGVKPPPKKIGKPTREAQEQKREYDNLYKKVKEAHEENDDSVLNAKLKSVGAITQ